MNEHNEATVEDHLEMVWAAFASKKKELDSFKDLGQKFDELEKDNQRMKKKFDESEKDNQKMKRSLVFCQAQLNSLAQEVQQLNEMKKKAAEDIEKLTSTISRLHRLRVRRLLNDDPQE